MIEVLCLILHRLRVVAPAPTLSLTYGSYLSTWPPHRSEPKTYL